MKSEKPARNSNHELSKIGGSGIGSCRTGRTLYKEEDGELKNKHPAANGLVK